MLLGILHSITQEFQDSPGCVSFQTQLPQQITLLNKNWRKCMKINLSLEDEGRQKIFEEIFNLQHVFIFLYICVHHKNGQ